MSTQLSERETKALEIAARTKLTRKGDVWIVPSQSGPKTYTVNPDPESPYCDCPDFESRRARCKHIYAVEITLKREYNVQTQTVTETVTVKKKYTQSWPEYNKSAMQREKPLY
jgi:SWIM zinc finger